MSKILEKVMNGEIPDLKENENFSVEFDLPFNLQKKEKIVWACGAHYYHQKTKSKYVGSSDGVSVRIMKGVYYRKSAYKGQRVQVDETLYGGYGVFAISNKHLYFSGDKPFRIRLDKIVSINAFEDGITIQKEGVTSKPQTFKDVDGWFIKNLIENLNQI